MYYIFVERQNNPDMIVGPYKTEEEGWFALTNAPVINGLVEEDCLDCYLMFKEEIDRLLSTNGENEKATERMTVDRDNPDFFGHEEKENQK